MAEVKLEKINKFYDKKVHAVKEASLHIKDKEFIVLVGPSGCGKSTLLRMIAGLEEISSGDIWIGDRLVNDIPPKNRDIAMVFQNYALYPHMSVYDNMAFGLKLRKFPNAEIKQRVEEAAELLGIKEFLDRKPKALSGGQRQRVAVGRAIVRKPLVFLFDEPLSNLDAKLRVQMRIEISKLHQRLETTMIYVTHDQVEAMTMGDRIVVMKDGEILQVDTPLNLYDKPSNAFVAGFIGSPAMNFFKGELVRNGGLKFHSDGMELQFGKTSQDRLNDYKQKQLLIGIRPEHITIDTDSAIDKPQITARVEVIEPMGNETFAYMKAGQTTFTMRTLSNVKFSVGDQLNLAIEPDKIHFFNPETDMTV